MELSSNSCVDAEHQFYRIVFYTANKCSLCKKRCLLRTNKMVKCIACKCVMHKRCLVASIDQRSGRDEQVSAVVSQDTEVLVEPVRRLVDDRITIASSTRGTGRMTMDPCHPVPIAHSAPAEVFVTMARRPSSPIPYVAPVAPGHGQLLRLMAIVARAFGPSIECVVSADIIRRPGFAKLYVAARIVSPAVNFATTVTITSAVRRMMISPAAPPAVSMAHRPSTLNRFVPPVYSGHDQVVRLRLMMIVASAFGPTIERVISVAFDRRPRLDRLVVVSRTVVPTIAPAVLPPPPRSSEKITAFECLKSVWASLSDEEKELRAKAQRLKMAPAPFLIKSKLTAQDYLKLSKDWNFDKMNERQYRRVIYTRTINNSNFYRAANEAKLSFIARFLKHRRYL